VRLPLCGTEASPARGSVHDPADLACPEPCAAARPCGSRCRPCSPAGRRVLALQPGALRCIVNRQPGRECARSPSFSHGRTRGSRRFGPAPFGRYGEACGPDRRGPAADAELAVYGTEVVADGTPAQMQRVCDLGVGEALGGHTQHLGLAGAQPAGQIASSLSGTTTRRRAQALGDRVERRHCTAALVLPICNSRGEPATGRLQPTPDVRVVGRTADVPTLWGSNIRVGCHDVRTCPRGVVGSR